MTVNHIGTQMIETERLLLRRFEMRDSENAFNNWLCDPEVQHNYGEPTYETLADTQSLLESWIASYDNIEFYKWVIVLKKTNVCIGQIAFYRIDSKNQMADVEYCVSRAYRGNGYAPEALKAVIAYAFEIMQFNRVQAFHRSKNATSGIVLKKAGMEYEGTLKQYTLHHNEFDDCLMYAILHSEWRDKGLKSA